jgi:hypothetical protein
MKKILFFSLLLLAIVAIAWFHLAKRAAHKPEALEPTNEVAQRSPYQPKTSSVEVASNVSSVQFAPEPMDTIEASEPINGPISAVTATNLEQWKTALKGLKKLAGFTTEQHWLIEQPGRKTEIPIVLSLKDKVVQYNAVLISVTAENGTGNVTEIQMQTPNMNIDEMRELGLQLCILLGVESTEFLSWCDKVGNHWLDAPLFSSKDFRDPNTAKIFGFETLMTYDNEKPWMINFIIQNP